MSRTVEVPQTQTPVKSHVFFNGQLGKFSTIKGEENAELKEIPFPFKFVVLDADAHRVGGKLGGIAKNSVKFKSNIAHPKYGRTLNVWLENDPNKIIASGTWGSMKNNPALADAKFVSLVYCLADVGNGKEICCIHLHGRALAAWIEGTQKKNISPYDEHAFVVKATRTLDGDGVSSIVPVFEVAPVSAETIEAANQADFDLQVWLSDQFPSEAKDLGIAAAGQNRSNVAGSRTEPDDFPTNEFPAPDPGDDLPF